MSGLCSLQIAGPPVTHFQQQGGGLTVDECEDAAVLFIIITGKGPVKTLPERIKRPETGSVTLSCDNLMSSQNAADGLRQLIGTAYMSAKDRDDILPQ